MLNWVVDGTGGWWWWWWCWWRGAFLRFQADIINIKLEGFIRNGTLFTSKVANIPSFGSQNQVQEQNQQPKSPSPAGRKQGDVFTAI